MTRTEKALSIAVVPTPPAWFAHSPTPSRPAEPATSLGTEDYQRYTLWKSKRENGSLATEDVINVSPALQAAMDNFGTYLSSSAYVAWVTLDQSSRIMQWRLHLVDVVEAVNAKATVPVSSDPVGIGTPAPGVGDIGFSGAPPSTPAPEYVVVGGTSSELVFGDDDDIVTVS